MFNLFGQLGFWLKCSRAYSLPMSVMSWVIPFVYGVYYGGVVFSGLLALIGIVFVHLGSNLFDDYMDYRRYRTNIALGREAVLQKGKCSFLIDGETTERRVLMAVVVYFALASVIGLYFIVLYKLPILLLMAVTGVLCLLYPRSSYWGFGEVIIGLIFSPLTFLGVYYVMTGSVSMPLMLLSVPFGLIVVVLLYVHSFMDYNYDAADGKRTLCTISGEKQRAYVLLLYLMFLAYFIIICACLVGWLPVIYLVTLFSAVQAVRLAYIVRNYIDAEPASEGEFLGVFSQAQGLTVVFTFFALLSFALEFFIF